MSDTDQYILEMPAQLWQSARIAAEPAASVGVAAVLTGAYQPAPGERIAAIISDVNLTPSQLDD